MRRLDMAVGVGVSLLVMGVCIAIGAQQVPERPRCWNVDLAIGNLDSLHVRDNHTDKYVHINGVVCEKAQ